MSGFLFNDIIFGPVRSRRLGLSLGINLLPPGRKVCSFDCVYCECGWTHHGDEKGEFPGFDEYSKALEDKLSVMHSRGQIPDAITFAGNGEPTLHPKFAEIMHETIRLRDQYFPTARIGLLSNATTLQRPGIKEAMALADINMLKLDTGLEATYQALNQSRVSKSLEDIFDDIKDFDGRYIIQTMFVKGDINGKVIDNSSAQEVESWLELIKHLNPEYIMIYSLDRATPISGLEPVNKERLEEIAEQVEQSTGFRVEFY